MVGVVDMVEWDGVCMGKAGLVGLGQGMEYGVSGVGVE